MFEDKIESLRKEIIKETCNMVKIPSVYSKESKDNMPFGEEINNALEYILKLGKKLGFRTKNLDGYCGYIEFGEGNEIVGIVGHLDVVPIGEGWEHDPFKAEIDDGKIFGRGTIDDKGPVIAALYAMKAVMDLAKVNKRVRLILGTNEENDWKCIDYYKEHEKWPTIGFSPDAGFPCIYAEKGIETIYFENEYMTENTGLKIKSIDCKNNAINVVPKYCKVDLEVDTNKYDLNQICKDIEKNSIENKLNITVNKNRETTLEIVATGISAHAAHPDLGLNAISMMVLTLSDLFEKYNIQISIFKFFKDKIGMEYDGKSAELNIQDESGIFTLNVGDFKLEDRKIKFGVNLRVPVETDFKDVEGKFYNLIRNYKNVKLVVERRQDPLYVSKDNYLVKTLTGIYNRITGRNEEPIAIGGGTYARAFKNVVSFGPNFPGEKDMCHQIDEFIKIDNLILASKIYAEAIYELAK